MKKVTILICSFLLAGKLHAQKFDMDQIYPIDVSHSFIEFSVTYMGYAEVKGIFSDFAGTFRYVEDQPQSLSVSFRIATNSINTNLEWRDNDLKSVNWFDAENFPAISFQSTGTKSDSEGLKLLGTLTIKDITKDVEIPLRPIIGVKQDVRGDDQVVVSGTYVMDRTEFGVEGKRWSQVKAGIAGVGNEVRIRFSMLGKQFNFDNLQGWVRNEERANGKLYAAYKQSGLQGLFKTYEAIKGEVKPNDLNIVGFVVMASGRPQDAVEIFKRNVADNPDNPDLVDSLGEAYANARDWKNARKQYLEVLTRNAESVNAREILRHLP